MKKTGKVQLLAATLGVMAAVTGIVLINNPVQAKAAEETATATFEMDKGAAVRAVKDEAGIRWETTVNKAWYNKVVSGLEEGQTITNYSFGTWVTSANNVGSVTELNETFTNEVKDLPCKVTPNFGEETTFTYYSSIVYTAEDLAGYTTEEVQKAYAAELIARSYMKYTLEGDETEHYAYADSNDNARCMRAVALAAYEETDPEKKLTDAQKQVVDDYFATGAANAVDFEGYYETAAPEAVTAYTTAYIGAKKVGEVNDGKLTIDGDFELGENYTLTLFDASGNYAETTEFQYITREVTSLSQLKKTSIGQELDGYYVLGADITQASWYQNPATFTGTLDGKGYKIYDSKFNVYASGETGGGLFYALKNATIKNLVMENVMPNYVSCGVFAYTNEGTSTFENVYVSLNSGRLKVNAGFVYDNTIYTDSKLILKDCFVYVPTHTEEDFGFVSAKANDNSIQVNNCTFVNGNGLIVGTDNTVENNNSAVVTSAADLTACSGYVKLTKENFDSTLPTLTTEIAVLTDDVDLGGMYLGGSNTFKGTLIGQGHTVSGIKVSENSTGGLFKTFNGTLLNVALKGTVVKQGGIICDTLSNSYMEDVYVEAEITVDTKAAAIARYMSGSAIVKMDEVVLNVTVPNEDCIKTNGAVVAFFKGTAAPSFTMTSCYYIAPSGMQELAQLGTSSGVHADSQDYKYFWDIGDTKADGTVMTEDDGLTGYTDYNTFYDAVYSKLSAGMQSFLPKKTAQSGE